MSDFDCIREEGERISREEGYKVLLAEIAARDKEIERLKITDSERETLLLLCEHRETNPYPVTWVIEIMRLLHRHTPGSQNPDDPAPLAAGGRACVDTVGSGSATETSRYGMDGRPAPSAAERLAIEWAACAAREQSQVAIHKTLRAFLSKCAIGSGERDT